MQNDYVSSSLAVVVFVVSFCNLFVPQDSIFYISTLFTVTILGKYLAFALLALALGFGMGIFRVLSLGHGAFLLLEVMLGLCILCVKLVKEEFMETRFTRLHGIYESKRVTLVLVRILIILTLSFDGYVCSCTFSFYFWMVSI